MPEKTRASAGEPAAVAFDLGDPALFIDRELSLLDFFSRVLEEAMNPANPLLERVRFLAIVSSNMAEFFMVRVSGLKQQVEAGVTERSPAGLTPSAQLQAVRKAAQELMLQTRSCLRELLPLLQRAGINILSYDELDDAQRTSVDHYFQEVVFPVLTPLAVDPGRPFPHISNMSLNLALVIRDPAGQERFARVKLPGTLPRLLPVSPIRQSAGSCSFVWLDQVVSRNLGSLFPGLTVIQSYPFRVTRDAEVSIQELEAEDLLETIERGVRQRRFGKVVRVTVDPNMPEPIRDILMENLEVEPRDIYTLEPPLGMSDIMQLHDLERPDLKYAPFVPAIPAALQDPDSSIFAAIRREEILLHHPYDSFTPVVDFLSAAARDPGVLAIKQTLYRVGRNSPVVEALLEAARNGKQVAVLVELKARFDEESNIEWARALESEGVHVVYGLLGLKTHSKLALVVRQEGERIRRYVHLSTGNYNAITAQQYTDLGLFTCDDAIGADASDVFNYLTGYSNKREYRKFLVAPINLRSGLERLIRREIDHQQRGGQGHLIFKINALVDKPMIQILYEAAQAGVRVELIVRGMCCLRPGVPGVSENIRVTSIVGRFLEHTRVFWFRNGGQEEVYLGSADLMMRNLDRRVEILFPVDNPRLIRYLRDDVLAIYLADTVKARVMTAAGVYALGGPGDNGKAVDAQAEFIRKRGSQGGA
jgi:polyphosphate kinase